MDERLCSQCGKPLPDTPYEYPYCPVCRSLYGIEERSDLAGNKGFPLKGRDRFTWIRREFHRFPSKVAENLPFVSKMLHQSPDFHKRSFSPPKVLIYESDGVSHPPTFG